MAINEGSPTKHPASPSAESPKKRRKVNHACIYCRRSHMTCDLERPCARCIKRSIGHLCHDEPREGSKSKSAQEIASAEPSVKVDSTLLDSMTRNSELDSPGSNPQLPGPGNDLPFSVEDIRDGLTQPMEQPSIATGLRPTDGIDQQFTRYDNWAFANPSNDPNLESLYTPYLFNAPDIGSEYNVLNNFLNTSLFDEGSAGLNDNSLLGSTNPNSDPPQPNPNALLNVGNEDRDSMPNVNDSSTSRALNPNRRNTSPKPSKHADPFDKEEERYYINIADPSGNDKPEERMKKLLEAKFKAGLLRPFNYIQGYARLNAYLEGHMQPALRQRMMRHIEKFRPKFRERMQSLTDMELTMVEMWFEKTLMEYDRVFASMAIPACCWRRTGEIFRGNKAMAELIQVPVDELRDGQLALQEIMAEQDLVNYWNNFLAIAFDNSQKAMLTSCHLRRRRQGDETSEIKCCFSFTIRRDARHNMYASRLAPSK